MWRTKSDGEKNYDCVSVYSDDDEDTEESIDDNVSNK